MQKLIDRLDGKYLHKFWTPRSLEVAMKLCGVTNPSDIKFPPRGKGMSGIENLEYLFSRDPKFLSKDKLKFPWPLATALNIQTSLRQCNWIWRRLVNGERIVRYSRYDYIDLIHNSQLIKRLCAREKFQSSYLGAALVTWDASPQCM